MPAAPLPPNEPERLAALRRYRILDTPPERAFDDFVMIASTICDVPIALVSMVDARRQWFKAKTGLEVQETPRDVAFCAYAILDNKPLVVNDATKDTRFANSDLVTHDPRVRFYAGVPLINPDGHALGTLCAIDRRPRNLDQDQLSALEALGRQVVAQLELRRTSEELARELRRSRNMKRDLEVSHERLLRTNRELEQFAYAASHDLKEPLRTVISFVQLLEIRHGEELGADARQTMNFIVEGAMRMRSLIDDLLALSRLGHNARPHEKFHARDALDNALANLSAIVNESGAIIECDALPEVFGDPSQLTQLFQNLIANAIRFKGPDHPRIRISSSGSDRNNPSARFLVSDNGIGIESKYHERIFQVFQRLNPRESPEGTGIGLSICRRIVDNHGGQIGLSSQPGRGSTFWFTIRTDARGAATDEPGRDRPVIHPDLPTKRDISRQVSDLLGEMTDPHLPTGKAANTPNRTGTP